ncbi:MAG: two-component regulator propeller domain-containing protein [Bacteroidota bacterium]
MLGLSVLCFSQTVQFNNVSLREGLSQNTITAIAQDDRGFIWIGTRDGLNRYDGYEFLVLRFDKADSLSICSNSISALHLDKSGNLWVGTNAGLSRLNTESLQSTNYYHWFEDSLSINSSTIKTIAEDALGQIWVGTDLGLNLMLGEGGFKRYSIIENDSTCLPGKEVNVLLLDEIGNLWVGTDGGLARYNPRDETFSRFRYDFENENSLSSNNIKCLAQGIKGSIWIGTEWGLNSLQVDSLLFKRFDLDDPLNDSLPSTIVQSLLFDDEKNLWIGTPSGLSKIDENRNISSYRYKKNEINSLPNDNVLATFQDISGNVWVGTESAGFSILDLNAPQFNSVRYDSEDGFSLAHNRIYNFASSGDTANWVATGNGIHLFCAASETNHFTLPNQKHPINEGGFRALCMKEVHDTLLFVGTAENGLWIYNSLRDSLAKYQVSNESVNGISSNRITDIEPDIFGNVWLGSAGGGLLKYHLNSQEFKVFRFDGENPNSIKDNNVISLEIDNRRGKLYLGTGNAGLYILDLETEMFESRYHEESDEHKIPSNSINAMCYSEALDELWLATNGEGLVRMNLDSNSVKIFDRSNGLANQVIYGITEDLFGMIWLSTNAGLTTFERSTETFRNYTEEDVLNRNTFLKGSVHRNKEGIIFFGGTNGFDYFNSIVLEENIYKPEVEITGYSVATKALADSSEFLNYLANDTLVLDADVRGISFSFSALSFKQSQKNQYAYRLVGLFDDWQYIGTRRYASFSNLKPGSYLFELIGSNNDGVWSTDPKQLTIIVKAPFWKAGWFKTFIVLILILIPILFYLIRVKAEQARRKVLEEAVFERTKLIAKERDTNVILLQEVHHRVKNNLQVIVSLLSLQSHYIADDEMKTVFSEVQNRVRSMSMIHQKMYKTKNLSSVNLKEYLDDLSKNLLETYQIGQNVDLEVDISVDRFNADTLTPLGLIINEIFSNSLKYAFPNREEGKISVSLHQLVDGRYQLLIGDNGIGFPDDFEGTDDSFGSELIVALTEQLNGTLKVRKDLKGAFYELDFEDMGRSTN